MRAGLIGVALIVSAALAGCGQVPESTRSAEVADTDPQIEAVFVETAPADVMSVIALRKSARPGDTVTVEGRVAGSEEPFSAYYATFVLADDSLSTCDRRPSDGCTTPWDACCEPPETIANAIVSIQVVGTDGRPVDRTLKGVRGLTELDTLIVTGTVAGESTPDNPIINATAIYRQNS
jgi:hypothetical protein